MAVQPTGTFGWILLGLVLFSYLVLIVLNLVSFSTRGWIVLTDVHIKFGIWRLCDFSTGVSYCSAWSSEHPTDLSQNVFPKTPGYIHAAQGLEIVSLVLYVFAGVIIIIACIYYSIPQLFLAAAVLLFLCIAFLSGALGVVGSQPFWHHTGYLHFSWWNGLVGLIFTIICTIALVLLSFAIVPILPGKGVVGTGGFNKRGNNLGYPPMVGGGFPPVYDPFIYGGGNLMSYNPQLFVQSQPMVSPQDELQQLTYLNYLLSQQQLQQQLQEQQQLQQLLYLQQLQEASYLPTYQPQLALSGYQPHQSSLISELARQYVQSEANSSFDIQPYGQAQYYDYL